MPVSLETEIVAGPPLPLSPELWLSAGGFCSIFFFFGGNLHVNASAPFLSWESFSLTR